jgi:hypothetical protein
MWKYHSSISIYMRIMNIQSVCLCSLGHSAVLIISDGGCFFLLRSTCRIFILNILLVPVGRSSSYADFCIVAFISIGLLSVNIFFNRLSQHQSATPTAILHPMYSPRDHPRVSIQLPGAPLSPHQNLLPTSTTRSRATGSSLSGVDQRRL